MKVDVKVKDNDRGQRAMMRRLRKHRIKGMTVGVHAEEGGNAAGDSGLTVLDVATNNEFGITNPERSFVRSWAEVFETEGRELLRKLAQEIVKADNVQQAAERVALVMQASLQAHARSGLGPPNAPSTIAKKKSSLQLVDSGQMVSSVLGKVEK